MLDFGWPELLVIVVVGVLVLGPDEIPEIMRGLGRMVRRLQYMKFALSKQFDDFMKAGDLNEMRGEALHRPYDPDTMPPSATPVDPPAPDEKKGDDRGA